MPWSPVVAFLALPPHPHLSPCLLQLSVWYQYDECDIPSPSSRRCDRHRGQCETPGDVTLRKLSKFSPPRSPTTSRDDAEASPCSHFDEKLATSLSTALPLFVDALSPFVTLVGTGHAQESLLDTRSLGFASPLHRTIAQAGLTFPARVVR
jgi:hypothetical protein